MSANSSIRVSDIVDRNGGLAWNRLHTEREDICEALLKECAADNDAQAETPGVSSHAATHAANWHRELLRARLCKIDDALDRLMAGSYGNCSKCGRWIEDTKLEFDPALTYCLECWQRLQIIH